ncbi:MAG TPA: PAS domain S-box protein [Geothrix sp.]|nr:PAS domain S-box protein [Geothrix sp.]
MGDDTRAEEDPREEIRRLKWRIATLETVETECTRALAALEASEARYRRLLDEAGFPITISTTADAAILFANPLACRMFGLEGPRPSGRLMLEFYPDPAARGHLVERLRAEGVVRGQEVMMRDGRGELRILIVTASLITYEGQEAVLATSDDITERRHAEALFRSVVETSPDGIGIADLEGTITYVSPRLVRLFGCLRPEDMLGRNLRTFMAREEHERVEARLMGILKGQYEGPTEWTALRGDGSAFPTEISGEVLRDPGGAPRAFFFIVRDISSRKRMERAIRWGEKLESLGLMAAGIAHELNNAFQVTQGHLELAQERSEGDAPLLGLLSGIETGVDRATGLAREMLAYSGQTLRVDAPVQIVEVVEELLALRREGLRPDLELAFSATGDLPALYADEGQVMKALSSLVLNAVEAMDGRRGSITLAAEAVDLEPTDLVAGFWPVPARAGRFVRLEIRDAGGGIADDRLERICDPFFSTRGPGRGLGLSVALGILRAHSACLQIQSWPGLGSLVRVYFPVSIQTPRAVLPVQVEPRRASGVLVAEDDPNIRDLVLRALPKWGFGPIFAAKHGAEALELFRAHRADIGLFLTDATMPGMSGPEAFEAMRLIQPSLRAVLMTGYSESFGQGTAASFGFTGFVQKPFSFAQLKAALLEAAAGEPPSRS